MSRAANVKWAMSVIKPDWVRGKLVLDIGSRDWSDQNPQEVHLYPWIRSLGPHGYIPIDSSHGKNVSMKCDGKEVVSVFGANKFDMVICLEVLEHEKEWQKLLTAAKQVVAPGGYFILTTRLPGYPRHGFPDDFWRFNADILNAAFLDFEIIECVEDAEDNGVYIACKRKPWEVPETLQAIEVA